MITRSGNRTILWALGLSCLLHAALLLAAPSPVRSHHVRQPVQQPKPIPVRFVEPEPLPDPEPQEREIDLGLDAPAPPSNTWLGFLEYIKQIAMHSEVEQAAFTDDPIAASPPPPLPAPEPDTPPVEATTPDDPHEQPADIKPDPTPQSADADVENLQPQPHQRQEQPQPEPALIERPVIEREQARSSRPLQQMLEELRTRAAAMMAQAEAVEHTQATPPPIVPQHTEPTPTVAPRRTVGLPNPGARSDRESDPSSIVDVPREHWQLGQPLAAQGLDIRPRRPQMTILTTITAWPANPLCSIWFGPDGVPTRAAILKSTGDSRVDAAIEASLYRWRASGSQLDQLRPGETVNLTIRLLINPRNAG